MPRGASQRGNDDRVRPGEAAADAADDRAPEPVPGEGPEQGRRGNSCGTRREALAWSRRAEMAGANTGAQPLHTMLLAICAAGEIRKEMLFALAERPRDVGTLARDMDLDQPRVSQHLSQLRKAGLVSCVCEGGRRVYSVGLSDQDRGGALRQVWVSRAEGVWQIRLEGSNGYSAVFADERNVPAPGVQAASVPAAVEVVSRGARKVGQPGSGSGAPAPDSRPEVSTVVTRPGGLKGAAKKAGGRGARGGEGGGPNRRA